MYHFCLVGFPKGVTSSQMQTLRVAASCGDKRWPQIYAASHTTAFFSLCGLALKEQSVIPLSEYSCL